MIRLPGLTLVEHPSYAAIKKEWWKLPTSHLTEMFVSISGIYGADWFSTFSFVLLIASLTHKSVTVIRELAKAGFNSTSNAPIEVAIISKQKFIDGIC